MGSEMCIRDRSGACSAPPQRQVPIRWRNRWKRMAENPFAEFSLEKAIDLRWTLRDIQASRLKLSPVSDEDLKTLTGLGLVEMREEGIALTSAGMAALNGP